VTEGNPLTNVNTLDTEWCLYPACPLNDNTVLYNVFAISPSGEHYYFDIGHLWGVRNFRKQDPKSKIKRYRMPPEGLALPFKEMVYRLLSAHRFNRS
jgi:hypothetical protein